MGASFHQCDFIKKMWNDVPIELNRKHRRTLAHEVLFKVDLNSELIHNNEKNIHHHVAEKCLLLSQRTREYLQISTGFHCTKVKGQKVED